MQKSLSPKMFVVAAREKIASRIVSLHIYTQGATCLKKNKRFNCYCKESYDYEFLGFLSESTSLHGFE